MSSPAQTINEFLRNFLNDIPTNRRLACFIVDGKVEVCLGGPHRFWFDPETNKIRIKKKYDCLQPIDIKELDRKLLRDIFHRIQKPEELTLDEKIKQEYGIEQKKKLNKKQLAEIAKYEDAFKANQ